MSMKVLVIMDIASADIFLLQKQGSSNSLVLVQMDADCMSVMMTHVTKDRWCWNILLLLKIKTKGRTYKDKKYKVNLSVHFTTLQL